MLKTFKTVAHTLPQTKLSEPGSDPNLSTKFYILLVGDTLVGRALAGTRSFLRELGGRDS